VGCDFSRCFGDAVPIQLTRQQILLIVCVLSILLWQGGGCVSEVVFGPFQKREQEYETLSKNVEAKRAEKEEVELAQRRLAEWRARSLPPDPKPPATTRSRGAEAIAAQSMYQEWITDLVLLAGFDNPSITPAATRRVMKLSNSRVGDPNVYVAVTVIIEAYATYGQLCTFLDHFHRANLLHRISLLKVESRESAGDPQMKVLLNAEALALTDVKPRKTLLAETTLAAPLPAAAVVCEVVSGDGFPKQPPFRIRIGNEYLTVTAIDGQTWTVSRGAERTRPLDHDAHSVVEFTPLNPAVPSRNTEEFRELLRRNPFIKPPPPKQYQLELGPLGEQVVVRGEQLDYTLPVKGYDSTLGKPEFVLAAPAPAGLQLDRNSGKITWRPTAEQPAGKVPLSLEIRHPNAPHGKLTAELTLVLREPNSKPVVNLTPLPVAYVGREWVYPLDLSDLETPRERLNIRLADGAPAGLTVALPAGELRWNPPETLTPGNFNVSLTVTDDGTPPQSTTTTFTLRLEDDAAQFTRLVGVVNRNGTPEAQLYNRLSDKTTYVHLGDRLRVADVEGEVTEIGLKHVLLKQGDQVLRWGLGDSLRDLQKVTVVNAADRPSAADEALRPPTPQ
jgi:hypothetical protein